ncbi:MAG: zinc ribbon domain-containing protein [Anaerolineae bacterium]|nr:zinc ribbon domain-containing protein [Anaerolineae bacterium]
MPIYEYRCSDCGAEVELLLRSSEAEPICPQCGSFRLEKLISAVNVMSGRTARPPGRTCCGACSCRDAIYGVSTEISPQCNDGSCCSA